MTGSSLTGFDLPVLTRLLSRCGGGDLDAFEQFYLVISPVLATLVAARQLPPAVEDRVLVEVYVAIWHQAHTFPASRQSVWEWTLTLLTDALTHHTVAC